MQKIILIGIVLILLASVNFAEATWQYTADAGITVKPIISGNNIFIGSQDGNLHSIFLNNGRLIWKKQVGKYVLQPILFQNSIIVANNNGTVTKLKKDGTIESQFNVPQVNSKIKTIFGIDSSQNKVYLTTDAGVFTLEANNVTNFFNYSTAVQYTSPTISGSNIIFGAGNELIAVNTNKQVVWRNKVADFWISKPVVENSIVYIGAQDNSIYAFNLLNGDLRWRYETNGWVASTPHFQDGIIYVGSNDGYLYALDAFSGSLKWKAKTNQAIQTTPLSTAFAGKNALLVGSTDEKLYVIEKETGKIIWRFVAGDWVATQ